MKTDYNDAVNSANTQQYQLLKLFVFSFNNNSDCLDHPTLEKISKSGLQQMVVTDTIPLGEDAKSCKKISVLSVARLLGEAIKRIHNNDSVSSLFV